MGIINVVNRHHYDGVGIYVGRGTPLGNPEPLVHESDRIANIERYRTWLRQQWKSSGAAKRELFWLAKLVNSGKSVDLVCSCAPHPCHADVIKTAILAIINNHLM